MSKTLLFVVNDAGFFVSHRLPIAKAAQSEGYEVHVATPPNEQMQKLFMQEGFVFHPTPLKRGRSGLINEVRYLLYLVGLYKKRQFDIVHHVTIKPVLFGGIAARFAKVPAMVSAISGMGYVFIKQGLKAAIIRKLVITGYRFALNHPNHKAIFQNPDDIEIFIENSIINKESAVMIKGSGVDVKQFTPAPLSGGDCRVVLPARMLWDKGVGEFVEAARILKQKGSHIHFILAGGVDTENPAAIPKSQLEAWVKEGVVKWMGFQEDMVTLYQNAHIVCLPSYREGLPKALIEAMACARAIITTDVPGCREVVEHGKNGLLVPVKDAGALADAIETLANDRKTLENMGQHGRQKAEQEFSVEQVVADTLKIYKELTV